MQSEGATSALVVPSPRSCDGISLIRNRCSSAGGDRLFYRPELGRIDRSYADFSLNSATFFALQMLFL